jgi:hypothetical protein
VGKRTDSTGLGSLATGAVTALALAVQTGLAAVVGVIIARDLGRTAETDGFFAAYGVFVVILLMGNAIRVTMLPSFARARTEGRLAAAVVSTGLLVGSIAAVLVVIAIAAAEPIADLLTGQGEALARSTAADALPWMVAAGGLQVLAGLAASALAALDDYVTAAIGFVSGSVAGLALILVLIDRHGVQAVAWGIALNGCIALLVPSLVLVVRGRAAGLSVGKLGAGRTGPASSTLRLLLNGVALPLALQAIYLICLPPASREGEGAVTSLGYAYLFSSAVVAVTASSIGLVTAVPMTRAGLGEGRAARHIVASAWLGVVAIGLTAGVLALGGGTLIGGLLGPSYASATGAEIGRLVVLLSPWAVATVGISVTYPLLFVHGRGWWLPILAVAVIALQVPLARLGQMTLGLDGIALSLAITTGLILVVMLAALGSAKRVLAGLAVASSIVGAVALVAFLPPWALLDPVPGAVVGGMLFVGILAGFRPPPLLAAWRYLRALT